MPDELLLHIFPPVLLSHGAASINLTLLLCIPPLVTTLFFLLLARFYFVRRAFAPARNRLLGIFRWLDSAAQRCNRLIGNVTFRARDRALPGDDPIAWREMTRTALGRPHYLVRLLVVLEIAVGAVCLWAVREGSN